LAIIAYHLFDLVSESKQLQGHSSISLLTDDPCQLAFALQSPLRTESSEPASSPGGVYGLQTQENRCVFDGIQPEINMVLQASSS